MMLKNKCYKKIEGQEKYKIDGIETKSFQNPKMENPHFFNITINRLVLLSFISGGIYQLYWIYKNWASLKKQNNLDFSPFWRTVLSYFYIHKLFNIIQKDSGIDEKDFPVISSNVLATIWIILTFCGNLFFRFQGDLGLILGIIFCNLPIIPLTIMQKYINIYYDQNNIKDKFRWSIGQLIILIIGFLGWIIIIRQVN